MPVALREARGGAQRMHDKAGIGSGIEIGFKQVDGAVRMLDPFQKLSGQLDAGGQEVVAVKTRLRMEITRHAGFHEAGRGPGGIEAGRARECPVAAARWIGYLSGEEALDGFVVV